MNAAHITIDPYSSSAIKIGMYFNETHLSDGTCFFWRSGDQVFLVTNWHNVTGKNPETNKHLSSTAAEPTHLRLDVWTDFSRNRRCSVTVQLYSGEERNWLEHPVFGRMVDVVCLPIDLKGQQVFPINLFEQKQVIPRVGEDVFVIGFPMSRSAAGFPLWKRASIASEPGFVDLDGLPYFLVDTATSKGMSGSPVLLRTKSGDLEDGTSQLAGGSMNRVLGVYSGRFASSEPLEAQLGRVWRVNVIEEIINQYAPGGWR